MTKKIDGMYIKNVEEITIFESPDGGKSVYSRKSGDEFQLRTLVKADPNKKETERWIEWRDILELSKTDVGLADLIEKVEAYYKLIK